MRCSPRALAGSRQAAASWLGTTAFSRSSLRRRAACGSRAPRIGKPRQAAVGAGRAGLVDARDVARPTGHPPPSHRGRARGLRAHAGRDGCALEGGVHHDDPVATMNALVASARQSTVTSPNGKPGAGRTCRRFGTDATWESDRLGASVVAVLMAHKRNLEIALGGALVGSAAQAVVPLVERRSSTT